MNRKLSKGIKLFLWCVTIIVVFGIIGTITGKDTKKTVIESKTPVQYVSLSALTKAYDDNEVAADNTYKNKVIELTGKIAEISKDFSDKAYIMITNEKDESGFTDIMCYFSNKNAVATLSKGQEINFTGEVTGKIMGAVMMKNCKLK